MLYIYYRTEVKSMAIEGMSELEFELEDHEGEGESEEKLTTEDRESVERFSQEMYSDNEERLTTEDRESVERFSQEMYSDNEERLTTEDRESVERFSQELEQPIAQEMYSDNEERLTIEDKEAEQGARDIVSEYTDKLLEISERQFDTEFELDREIQSLVNNMERDFFSFGGVWKKLKQGGRFLAKAGLNAVKGLPAFRVVKGLTQLARGNLKGLLATLAKAGMGAAISAFPGGAIALPALRAMGVGFEVSDDSDVRRRALYNVVDVSRESFEYLARNFNEKSNDPIEANRLAANAFQYGLKKVRSKTTSQMIPGTKLGKKVNLIKVRKGQRIRIGVLGLDGAIPSVSQHMSKKGRHIILISGV
jgi:hypothetical protein